MRTLILLLIVSIIFAGNLQAQVRFANRTNEKITITSVNNVDKVIVNPRSTSFVHFLSSSGKVEFQLGHYVGLNEKQLGIASRQAENGRVTISSLELNEDVEPDKEEDKKESSEEKINTFSSFDSSKSGSQASRGDWWSETNLRPHNASSFRITVLDHPFKGLALAPEQTSSRSITLKTGEYIFPVYFDPEVDSLSTGRQYRWAVVSKIVVEGQDTLKITDYDLMQVSSGEQIRKSVRNNLNVDFLIVHGENAGKVIPANNMSVLNLRVGWNVIPVQYKNQSGLPVQAVLLLMANNLRSPLIADRRSEASLVSIEPENLIITGR